MRVHDFRPPRQIARELHNALREKDESLRVVRIIMAGLAVKTRARVERRVINEIDREPLRRLERPDACLHASGAEWQIDGPIEALDRRELVQDSGIEWRYQADLVPCPAQGFGEGGHHVGEAAALRERMDLTTRQENSHTRLTFATCLKA